MSELDREYIKRVQESLEGLSASPGISPGCMECAKLFDYSDETDCPKCGAEDPEPECGWCKGTGQNPKTMEAFAKAWAAGEFSDEGHFSWSRCGVCNGPAGDRYVWHWIGKDKWQNHSDDMCSDCVLYLANGTLPNERG